ncbi:unnamed protein product [Danaus chrysippus]|uniref:(African queen) hypothetical protein n=1 Tax=Danaus chrysippus TaxID=151541 RepID=A0A8J2QIV8_9NEOP|nr:unnamed protein product [Danaus chrysippus]
MGALPTLRPRHQSNHRLAATSRDVANNFLNNPKNKQKPLLLIAKFIILCSFFSSQGRKPRVGVRRAATRASALRSSTHARLRGAGSAGAPLDRFSLPLATTQPARHHHASDPCE